ncbi:MAG: hypothetical protein ACLTX6_05860 [Lachnospiraceae bacterium]
MTDRWKMHRIGFVNFWLYDEEEFEFEDGKLLLRGQNGSGKSITTQSFIPFVLDGDRTPSRLDPFGSSDRRMEYYFLGEEGREESTGYLFLEFKKKNQKNIARLVSVSGPNVENRWISGDLSYWMEEESGMICGYTKK